MTTISAGIDVSKDFLDAHACGEDRSFANDAAGFEALEAWLRGHGVERVVVESTSRLHWPVHEWLHERGHVVVVVNPARPRHFAGAVGRLAKTDRIDATVLAEYGAAVDGLRPTEPEGEIRKELRNLLVMRSGLVDARARIGQTAGVMPGASAAENARRAQAALDREIADIDARMERMVAEQPEFAERHEILTSVKGVGKVTSAAVCCLMPELGRIGNRQAAALLGVAPMARDSGQGTGARHTVGGRRRLREILYMAAVSASRWNPELREFHERLIRAGKAYRVAIVAVMRKLIVMLNSLLRDRRKWTPKAPIRFPERRDSGRATVPREPVPAGAACG